MYRAVMLLAVLAVVGVCPSSGQAQQIEMFLITNEVMQEELKITPEQKEKIESIHASWLEGSRAARAELATPRAGAANETESPEDRFRRYYEAGLPNTAGHYEKLEAVLKPEQLRRLSEVALQSRATDVAGYIYISPRVAKELELCDDQKKRIADTFFSRFGRRGSRPDGVASTEAQERNEKVLAILSDDQRNKLKSMEGRPFDDLQKLQTASRRGSADVMFDRYDKDADGKLTESETPEGMWARFGPSDSNGDGAVDKDEFAKAFPRLGSRGGEFVRHPAPVGWAANSSEDYSLGTDEEVSHGGKVAGYIKAEADRPSRFGTLVQSFNAADFRGKRVRMSAYVKVQNLEGWSGLWLRVDGSAQNSPFDNMNDRPIDGTADWKEYEIVLDVPDDALAIFFGILMNGKGQVWVDDFKFEVVGDEVATTAPDRPAKELSVEARGQMRERYQDRPRQPVNLDFETQ